MHYELHGECLLSQLTLHILRVPETTVTFNHKSLICINNQLLF